MKMEEGFIEVGDHKIHHVKWGLKGPKILLIHSMGMDAHSMDLLADNLKNDYRVLSLTILGHGDSSVPQEQISLPEHAEILREAYKEMDFTPNLLIGHSVGGMLGMVLTAEHHDEHHGLVLVDIAPFESTGSTRPLPPDYFLTKIDARKWIRERYPGFTDYYVDNRMKYALTEKDSKYFLKPRGDSIRPGLRTDLWPYVRKIRVPTLLLVGEESDLVTPETRRQMERTMKDLEIKIVEETGHMIHQGRTEEFNDLIRGFLKKLGIYFQCL
jgi:esterase